jgi:hypothetical protein
MRKEARSHIRLSHVSFLSVSSLQIKAEKDAGGDFFGYICAAKKPLCGMKSVNER